MDGHSFRKYHQRPARLQRIVPRVEVGEHGVFVVHPAGGGVERDAVGGPSPRRGSRTSISTRVHLAELKQRLVVRMEPQPDEIAHRGSSFVGDGWK